MGGVTTRNMWNSLQKYNKLYVVASCWTITDIDATYFFPDHSTIRNTHQTFVENRCLSTQVVASQILVGLLARKPALRLGYE